MPKKSENFDTLFEKSKKIQISEAPRGWISLNLPFLHVPEVLFYLNVVPL